MGLKKNTRKKPPERKKTPEGKKNHPKKKHPKKTRELINKKTPENSCSLPPEEKILMVFKSIHMILQLKTSIFKGFYHCESSKFSPAALKNTEKKTPEKNIRKKNHWKK